MSEDAELIPPATPLKRLQIPAEIAGHPDTYWPVAVDVVTEYGERVNDGGFNLWPPDNDDYPTDRRIRHGLRGGRRVVRRRIVVIEDWAEVDAP